MRITPRIPSLLPTLWMNESVQEQWPYPPLKSTTPLSAAVLRRYADNTLVWAFNMWIDE